MTADTGLNTTTADEDTVPDDVEIINHEDEDDEETIDDHSNNIVEDIIDTVNDGEVNDELEEPTIDEIELEEQLQNDNNKYGLRDRTKLNIPKRYQINYTSIKKALSEYGEEGRKAILKEINQMVVEKEVMRPVNKIDVPANINIINTHLIVKGKMDAMGNHIKVKGRLVADGSQQIRELYEDVSSPTVRLENVLIY